MSEVNEDIAVEQWKIKKLIKSLEAARGNGTSVISLIIPPKTQISQVAKMLVEEAGTASNIKSRTNRLSVLTAITSAQQRLKLFNKVPENGLVLYCGEVLTSEGKEKKVTIDIEPFKPINNFLYMCDNRFHIGPLKELLADDEKFGFIIMDGNGALFGVVCGSNRTVLQKFSVELPKKHGRGGQSAPRFARIRQEKRLHYVKRVCEVAVSCFITNDKVNVSGLIFAGSADFKNELTTLNLLDPRLSAAIITTLDIAYGGESGFSQAIDMAGDVLSGVKLVREKKILTDYFSEISRDTGKYCYGVNDTLSALEMGAVSSVIVYENLPHERYEIRNKDTGVNEIRIVNPEDEHNNSLSGDNIEVISSESLLEWLSNNYKSFGTTLTFVSNKSPEGTQFEKGFGGIGGVLRYQVDFANIEVEEISDEGFI